MKTTTRTAAKVKGFEPLTTGFRLPDEEGALNKVLADLSRAAVEVALVPGPQGVEIWRKALAKPTQYPAMGRIVR